MLKVVELITSNSEEGIEEDTSRWGRDVVVEERRRRREDVFTGVKCMFNGKGGVVDVYLIS